MKAANRRRAIGRWLLASALGLVALYALAGYLLVPALIERQAPGYLRDRLGLQASIGAARLDPFRLVLRLQDVRLSEGSPPAGEPVLAFDQVLVDLEAGGLLRGTWTIAEARIERPVLHARIGRDGRLDLAELADRLAAPEPEPEPPAEQAAPRVLVRRAAVVDGQVSLDDLRGAQPARLALQAVQIEAFDVSTLPGPAGRYTAAARLPQAGSLAAQGSIALAPPASVGQVRLEALPLATVWPFVRDQVRLDQVAGAMTVSARYEYGSRDGGGGNKERGGAGEPALRLDDVALQATGLLLASKDGDAFRIELASVEARQARLDLARRRVELPALALRRGALALTVGPDGSLALPLSAAAAPAAPGKRAAANPDAVANRDANARPAMVAEPDAAAEPNMTPKPAATASAAPPTVSGWRVEVPSLRVEDVALRLTDRSRAAPVVLDVGAVDAGLRLAVQAGEAPTRIEAQAVTVRLARLALAPAGTNEPLATVESLALDGGRLDTQSRTLGAESVVVQGARTALTRAPDGAVALLHALRGVGDPPAADPPAVAAGGSAASPAPPWRHALGSLVVRDSTVALADRGYSPPLAYRLGIESAAIRGIGGDAGSPMPFEAKLRVAEGGTIEASGTVAADAHAADVRLAAEAVALGPLQPLLARYAAVELRSGALSATARIGYGGPGAPPAGWRAQGRLGVADLLVAEAASGDRLVSFKRLEATGVSYDSGPNRLAVEEVDLTEPGAKLIISKDRRVNLAQVMRPASPPAAQSSGARRSVGPPGGTPSVATPSGTTPSGKASPSVMPPGTAAPAAASPPLQARIERVRLRDGLIDYADLSLVLPFSTRVSAVEGTLLGLSTGAQQRARVQASGRIPPYGEASVQGTLLPFEPARFLDLHVKFENVAIPPLSPYTATFAGRTVDSGRLWLDLEYRIDDGRLLGSNQVRLADFKLGERIKAPDALDLPLDLAVALLADAEGRIDLAVPISGDLDDPQVDVGGLVREALGRLVRRIVSAPFRALGNLFGRGGAEQAARIEFDAGSDAFAPQGRESLDRIAQALRQRPRLALVVSGPYAPDADARALRAERARTELAAALGEAGEAAGPIDFDDARTQQALARMLDRLAGAGSAAAFTRAGDDGGQGPAASTGSAAAARFEAMFERIAQAYPLDDTALQQLAAQRAQRIVAHLAGPAGIGADRVRTGRIMRVDAGSDGSVAAPLELAAGAS